MPGGGGESIWLLYWLNRPIIVITGEILASQMPFDVQTDMHMTLRLEVSITYSNFGFWLESESL